MGAASGCPAGAAALGRGRSNQGEERRAIPRFSGSQTEPMTNTTYANAPADLRRNGTKPNRSPEFRIPSTPASISNVAGYQVMHCLRVFSSGSCQGLERTPVA